MSRKPYVNPQVPTRDVDRWLGRVKVTTPDSEMVALLYELIDAAPDRAGFTPAIRLQTQRYALWRHHQNYALFVRVMQGSYS